MALFAGLLLAPVEGLGLLGTQVRFVSVYSTASNRYRKGSTLVDNADTSVAQTEVPPTWPLAHISLVDAQMPHTYLYG